MNAAHCQKPESRRRPQKGMIELKSDWFLDFRDDVDEVAVTLTLCDEDIAIASASELLRWYGYARWS